MELLDRNYYRMLELTELIELSESKPTAELAVVLGERINEMRHNAAKLEIDIEELTN
jgi:hypothetical protein